MNKRQAPDGSFPDAKPKGQQGRWSDAAPIDNGGEYSWSDVDSELLRNALTVVTDSGDAISFAVNRTRSGGSITILSGQDRPRFYANNVEEATALLRHIIAIAIK